MQPGNRRVLWGEVEHLWYSHRNRRYFGFPLPENRSLRLCMRDTKPLDLPHRFNKMDHLVSLVRKHVDPILLARAINIFHAQDSFSFGEQVTITRDALILRKRKKSLPLDQVGRITIHGRIFQVTDLKNRVVFSSLAELVPDATIISELLREVRKYKEACEH
jgi:hypothetical protein